MRIIAGEYRGRTLQAPLGVTTRPTADKIRESVFHILEGSPSPPSRAIRVLDLFAGSGALAIEALSRGAKEATLIDADKSSLLAIRANLQSLRLDSRARVVGGQLPGALTQLAPNQRFDLIFADPPYALDPIPTLRAAAACAVDGGVLCLEHAASERPSPGPPWRLLQRRKWGATGVSFFERMPAAAR